MFWGIRLVVKGTASSDPIFTNSAELKLHVVYSIQWITVLFLRSFMAS